MRSEVKVLLNNYQAEYGRNAGLNLYPLPNITNRALTGGNYNYQYQEITTQPKKQNLVKVDYNPTSNGITSGRATRHGGPTAGVFKGSRHSTRTGTISITTICLPLTRFSPITLMSSARQSSTK